jgi:hypothetical protein
MKCWYNRLSFFWLLILPVFLLDADILKPSFDVYETIEQVMNHRNYMWSREGEFLIDTLVIYLIADSVQWDPAVAFDGTNYLIVWGDARSGPYAYDYAIYAARVNQAGEVLDPAGIIISNTAFFQRYPSVAFDGTNYLVVWDDMDSVGFWNIYGTRVSQSGQVLDSISISITSTPPYEHHVTPSVAFGGDNYLVVWCYEGADASIYGARVSQEGLVLEGSINISTAYSYQGCPSVAFDGTNYFVVWEDRRNGWLNSDIYGARVDQAGAVLDPNGIAISAASGRQHNPTIAFDATNYLIVWDDSRDSLNGYDIYGTRVDQDGVVIDPTGIAISTAADSQRYPAVTFDGEHYLVVWQDSRYEYTDIYGTHVSQAGMVLEPHGIAISTASDRQQYPAVAFGNTGFLAVWHDRRNDYVNPDIYGTRLSRSGVVLDTTGIIISTNANQQMHPSVAFDGTNYLLVWQDCYNEFHNTEIRGARVGSSGVVLDSATLEIAVGSNNQFPSVAFDGTNYLVVWGRSACIFGRRVSQTGEMLGQPFVISSGQYGRQCPAVSFDGTNYLVVWEDERNSFYVYRFTDIYGARVSPMGVVLDPSGIAIMVDYNAKEQPSLSFDGTNYLVVWQDSRAGYCDVYGTRVSQAGTVLDPGGIVISAAENRQQCPSVTFGETDFLVVWHDRRNGSYNPDIYGARLNQQGVILDSTGIAISACPEYQISPAIAFDGVNYVVVWSDSRSISNHDLYAARVDPFGAVIDEFIVSTQTGDQVYPAIAHGQGDQMFITYSGFADSVNHQTANAMRIWGKFYPFTGLTDYCDRKVIKSLLEIYPNPFTRRTVIRYSLPAGGWLIANPTLEIYDCSGRLVRSFDHVCYTVNQESSVAWNGTDDAGRNLPSGVYILRLHVGNYSATAKLLLIR